MNSGHSFFGYNTLFQSAAIRLTAITDYTHTHTHARAHTHTELEAFYNIWPVFINCTHIHVYIFKYNGKIYSVYICNTSFETTDLNLSTSGSVNALQN
jgi:hypothetical protein